MWNWSYSTWAASCVMWEVDGAIKFAIENAKL